MHRGPSIAWTARQGVAMLGQSRLLPSYRYRIRSLLGAGRRSSRQGCPGNVWFSWIQVHPLHVAVRDWHHACFRLHQPDSGGTQCNAVEPGAPVNPPRAKRYLGFSALRVANRAGYLPLWDVCQYSRLGQLHQLSTGKIFSRQGSTGVPRLPRRVRSIRRAPEFLQVCFPLVP